MAGPSNVSPYAASLYAHIAEIDHARKWDCTDGKGLTDTERRNVALTLMRERLSEEPGYTIKTGQLVEEFVKFENLDPDNPEHITAFREVQAETLPSLAEFIITFAVMCHLNDKVADPDKLCTPRQSRLLAILRELNNPGTTEAPEGYANDHTIGWTYEVKHTYEVSPYGQVLRRTDDGPLRVVPLERVYTILATNHIKLVNGLVKHLGRDITQKTVRKLHPLFPTQILKDFVASCPGCIASTKRVARQAGATTTKANGGNRGAKANGRSRGTNANLSPSQSNKRSRSGSDGNCDNSSQQSPAKYPRRNSLKLETPDQRFFPSNCGSTESGYPAWSCDAMHPSSGDTDYKDNRGILPQGSTITFGLVDHPVNDHNLPQGSNVGATNYTTDNYSNEVASSAENPDNTVNPMDLVYEWNRNHQYPAPFSSAASIQQFNHNAEVSLQLALDELVDPDLMIALLEL